MVFRESEHRFERGVPQRIGRARLHRPDSNFVTGMSGICAIALSS